jgi:membrane protease YdiL (CAAX protease family)
MIRASYHLYQGFGGFVGNLVMGLIFAKIYQRIGRTTPLVIAHFLMDAFVFVGFALLAKVISLP